MAPAQNAAVGVALVVLLVYLQSGLPRERPERTDAPRFALPTGALLLPAIVAFVCLMAEGAILDWSSIYLADKFDATTLVGGGVVGFGVAMAAVSSVGYTGFLTGPPLMGFVGQAVSLSGAFAALAAAVVLVAALSSMWLANAPADQRADAR